MKVKAKVKDGVLKVKMMIKHEMLTYDQAARKGLKANFVTHIVAKIGDEVVYEASTSQFLSKNPIVKYKAHADFVKKGDKIVTTVTDLSGHVEVDTSKVKI